MRDLDRDFECLPLEWDGDQDLSLFLRGGGGGSSFIFPFDGTSPSEDSLPLLKLLNDDESSDSGFVVCCADCFDLEEGSDEPFPAEPQGDLWTFVWLESTASCAGCFDFEEGLGDLSTILQLGPSGSFFSLASSDFFGVLMGVTSAVS